MSFDRAADGTKSFKEKNIPRIRVLEDSWKRLYEKIKEINYPKTSYENNKVAAWTVFASAIFTYVPYIGELKNLVSIENNKIIPNWKLIIISVLYIIAIIVSLIIALSNREKEKTDKTIFENKLKTAKDLCESIEEESGYKAHKEQERKRKESLDKQKNAQPLKTSQNQSAPKLEDSIKVESK